MTNTPEFLKHTIGKSIKIGPLTPEEQKIVDAWGSPPTFLTGGKPPIKLKKQIYKQY